MRASGLATSNGMAIGGAKHQHQQQDAGDQPFTGCSKMKVGNAHVSPPNVKLQSDCGLPLSAPEKALTSKGSGTPTNSNLAIDAANPASPKKPIYPRQARGSER